MNHSTIIRVKFKSGKLHLLNYFIILLILFEKKSLYYYLVVTQFKQKFDLYIILNIYLDRII